MSPRRFSVLLACAVALALAPATHAQQGGGRGSGRGRGNRVPRATVDLDTARKLVLEKDPPDERDFTSLVQSAFQEAQNRKLPSAWEDPETYYSPEYRAFRAEVYGPLLELPRTREFLRALAGRAMTNSFDWAGSTAAQVLADAPDEADFAALYAGYVATPPENRASPARQLGRAIAALRAHEPTLPQVPQINDALARLEADATEGKPSQRGAAIEGLFRADEAEIAIRVLKPLLSDEHSPLETITVLQSCSRLFQKKDIDPFMKARALATAESAIERTLASEEEVAPTQVISVEGRTLRAAISFLQTVGGVREFDLFMQCLESERAQRLLGMDGLQNLRFGLQQQRPKATPEQCERLDEHWLAPLLAAGGRLFALEEEPMEPEEQRAFWDARDLRYNALSYFCDQFMRVPEAPAEGSTEPRVPGTVEPGVPGVRDRLGREPDLPVYLAALYRAKEDVTAESEDGVERFTAVGEKLENRVLALQLLALIQREWNRDPGGLDLFAEAYTILSTEIQAPVMAIADVVAFRASTEPGRTLDIPVIRRPDDTFVQGAAAQTIANLGFVVQSSPTAIRVEVDAEHPWPWPEKQAVGGGAPLPAEGGAAQKND